MVATALLTIHWIAHFTFFLPFWRLGLGGVIVEYGLESPLRL